MYVLFVRICGFLFGVFVFFVDFSFIYILISFSVELDLEQERIELRLPSCFQLDKYINIWVFVYSTRKEAIFPRKKSLLPA